QDVVATYVHRSGIEVARHEAVLGREILCVFMSAATQQESMVGSAADSRAVIERDLNQLGVAPGDAGVATFADDNPSALVNRVDVENGVRAPCRQLCERPLRAIQELDTGIAGEA